MRSKVALTGEETLQVIERDLKPTLWFSFAFVFLVSFSTSLDLLNPTASNSKIKYKKRNLALTLDSEPK